MEPADEILELDDEALEIPADPMRLNMGPSHPAMHGTIRMVLDLDGETVMNVDVQPGYLHRGFEKSCERGTWAQVFPYADRLNYVSPMLNNVGFALAVEKLLDIEVPERCQWYRVILGELSRVCDHFTCNGASAMELGAFTPFLWLLKVRDWIWDILEKETGARMTHSFGRIGGMAAPPTDGFKDDVRAIIPEIHKVVGEAEGLLLKNRIFQDRMQGVGILTKERALALGVTGPVLRSTGVAYDVRKDFPYMTYGDVDFDVPVGTDGDNWDRFMVRMEEVRQAVRIIEQALEKMPDEGPVNVDDPRIVLPEKREVYTTIEATIAHFKLVMEGLKCPKGAVYSFTEGGNGELGFYLVSDGSGTPYRCRVRPPCWFNLQAAREMLLGDMIADIIPTFGSVNMIGGECDR
ncbi:MAG TPA: NADH-quinone oxidoreductase subunit D [Polyangiaceae bacterium LLY-WYZ-15_(1-7)]|nr:NADH-quinone oxidoreductase subunit D [Myxococcales bacterium]MAT28673.1 NADH-quinone oxidoreductase subunit D [Sandaracinus sp.]HJL05233.1 NADH-quinone oxidoreductase subunit D [Polyangiaceae bacterium LLY-WYZ-15_(1-7)]MBJ75063.1 NADH-quinone oxidoreductase subunit D [Sandaracinus sp.]HJL08260.1 NADH-quinone oxidoreductase subunit D [Polyangiaceae bacterium LLY-WYZ-15_(1-7)]